MKIIAGNTELWVNFACEDNLYQGETFRPILKICSMEMLTPEQVTALTTNPIDVYDSSNALVLHCEGYNAIKEYGLTLLKATTAEQQITTLQVELNKVNAMKQNLETAKANLERVTSNLEVENASLLAQKATLESQIAALEAQLAAAGGGA